MLGVKALNCLDIDASKGRVYQPMDITEGVRNERMQDSFSARAVKHIPRSALAPIFTNGVPEQRI